MENHGSMKLACLLDVAVVELTFEFLDATRLMLGLQQGNEIARSLSGCLEPEALARRVTDGLVEKFGCAFARIWLVEADRAALRLVASSGMYTRLDGSFSRVPMGAFKVGKIAQHGIPFLSNQLAEESWVRDREWAIAQGICGFAGYPLVAAGKVVGVLAAFSQQPMQPEFLEVLQGLCTTVTIALENALQSQQQKQFQQSASTATERLPLSEQIATLLGSVRLTLVGTERPLTTAVTYLFLRTAEALSSMPCLYCRLTYGTAQIALEAMIVSAADAQPQRENIVSAFGDLLLTAACLGGNLTLQTDANPDIVQVLLTIPYPSCAIGWRLRIRCRSSVLQMAFTHLAYLAGLTVCPLTETTAPLLTDNPRDLPPGAAVLWITSHLHTLPRAVKAIVDLSIAPAQLREAVAAVAQGETWGLPIDAAIQAQPLTDREQEILTLLAQGLRDRDIANQLHISDRTVKFHISNTLAKLKARTRCQALHQFVTRQHEGDQPISRATLPMRSAPSHSAI